MKKILTIATVLLAAVALFACSHEEEDAANGNENLQGGVLMTATVTAVSDKLEVNVIEGEYGASGPYWVVIAEETRIKNKKGEAIEKDDLQSGDTVQIRYGGQVMMSYPPQIVATEIAVTE